MPPKKATMVGKPPTSRMKSDPARKREHDTESTGESPVKKRETVEEDDDASNRLFLVGYTPTEIEKYQGQMKKDWTIQESFSDTITHLVIKSMGSLKNSHQLLPIYYAVLKGIFVLKPSFLPHAANRRKSLGGPTPMQDEEQHAYDGKEIDANTRAYASFPSILEVVKLQEFVRNRKSNREPPILGSAPFQKVAIVAGRTKESKQRGEELRLVMEAGGATVVEDTVFKAWKANNKKKKGGAEVETPSMVVIINGEKNMAAVGLDDETIRDLLKARAPLFYEEFITNIFMYMQPVTCLDDLLLQSFVFIHDTMKSVDPDCKLQALVLEDDDVGTPLIGRRPNSRVSSTARQSASSERVVKETSRRGRGKGEEEGEGEEKAGPSKAVKKDQKEGEAGPSMSVKKDQKEEEAGTSKSVGKEQKEEREEVADPPKKARGRPRKIAQKEVNGEANMEEETPKGHKKEVKRGRPKKEVKMEVKKEEDGEEMDVDPSLIDGGHDDLLEAFEKEIEERERGGAKERGEEEMRELEELREMRGDYDGDEGEMKEQPATPEPILFSQEASQPEIVIPEDLKKALEVKVEEQGEDQEIKKEVGEEKTESQKTPSLSGLAIEDEASDDGSDTVIEEKDDESEDMERLREEMNDERGRGVKKEEEEGGSETPQGLEPASELGFNSVAPIVIEDAKECETCNHLGAPHLYINQQTAREIEKHFASTRLDWFDLIIDVKRQMPWIREGKVLRPASGLSAASVGRHTVDLFYSFFHELNDETEASLLLSEVNSSDAMEMYECEWDETRVKRPPVALMIKMLHEFTVKCHAEDLDVPGRACYAIKRALPAILPSSPFGRHYWLTILAGGSLGIKGRAAQVIEEMAKRCKTFFIKALLTDSFLPCVAQFVTYFFEVDLLCAQTPVIDYDLPSKKKKEEESVESQRSTRGRKDRRKKNPLDNFPLILLLVMDLDESPRRGLTESAILMIQKLMELVVMTRRYQEWDHAVTLKRALLCLLEAARWHCAQAASSALTGAERRRVKAAESAGEGLNKGPKVTLELQQNIQRAVRWINKKGLPLAVAREILCLGWLEDIVDAME